MCSKNFPINPLKTLLQLSSSSFFHFLSRYSLCAMQTKENWCKNIFYVALYEVPSSSSSSSSPCHDCCAINESKTGEKRARNAQLYRGKSVFPHRIGGLLPWHVFQKRIQNTWTKQYILCFRVLNIIIYWSETRRLLHIVPS